jgi:hypothetical protein
MKMFVRFVLVLSMLSSAEASDPFEGDRGSRQRQRLTSHSLRENVMEPYQNSASPEGMKMMSLYTFKLFGPALLAYSLDRLGLHWMENVLSHQQKTGKSALKVFNNLREQKTLYRGLLGRSLTIAPARVLTLTTYYSVLDSMAPGHGVPLSCAIAGILAGVVDATATCPGENARTRATFDMPKSSSLKESYRAYWALLARSSGAPIILSGATLLIHYQLLPSSLNNGWYAGLITGALSQIITSPCDVIKNELMSHPEKSYLAAIKDMVSSKSAYRGIGTKVIRMSVGSGIVVGIIEYLNGIITNKY